MVVDVDPARGTWTRHAGTWTRHAGTWTRHVARGPGMPARGPGMPARGSGTWHVDPACRHADLAPGMLPRHPAQGAGMRHEFPARAAAPARATCHVPWHVLRTCYCWEKE